jgi:hypothetical protein
MFASYTGNYLQPGQMNPVETVEQDLTSVVWNNPWLQVIGSQRLFDGAARDAGNTGYTDVLRPGLLLTKTAAGKFIQWGAVVDVDTDKIEGILLSTLAMQREGTNADRWYGYVLLGGYAKVNGIIVPGQTSAGIVGHAKETRIRTLLKNAIKLDDDPFCHLAS